MRCSMPISARARRKSWRRQTSYTPINNDAQPKVDASVTAFLTNTPERQKQGYQQNIKFWVENFQVAQEKWSALMAGN